MEQPTLMDKEDATVEQPSAQGTKQSPVIQSTKSGNGLKAHGELVHCWFLKHVMFCKVVIFLGQFIWLNTYRVESDRSGTFNLAAIVDGSLNILIICSTIFISDLILPCIILLDGLARALF